MVNFLAYSEGKKVCITCHIIWYISFCEHLGTIVPNGSVLRVDLKLVIITYWPTKTAMCTMQSDFSIFFFKEVCLVCQEIQYVMM